MAASLLLFSCSIIIYAPLLSWMQSERRKRHEKIDKTKMAGEYERNNAKCRQIQKLWIRFHGFISIKAVNTTKRWNSVLNVVNFCWLAKSYGFNDFSVCKSCPWCKHFSSGSALNFLSQRSTHMCPCLLSKSKQQFEWLKFPNNKSVCLHQMRW